MQEAHNSKMIPIGTGVLVALLLVIGGLTFKYKMKQSSIDIINTDINNLVRILEKINKDCVILEFDYQKNPINFLTIKSFVGSEAGPMNLEYPYNWHGPYLDRNPSIQGIEYQVVHTRKGYFVTPGQGVKLPNGKIIGKDILLDENADIASMVKDPNKLNGQGKPLALQFFIGKRAY